MDDTLTKQIPLYTYQRALSGGCENDCFAVVSSDGMVEYASTMGEVISVTRRLQTERKYVWGKTNSVLVRAISLNTGQFIDLPDEI